MKASLAVFLAFLCVGCAGAPDLVSESKEDTRPAFVDYQPISFDVSPSPWKAELAGVQVTATRCSYQEFVVSGAYIEQIYCKATFHTGKGDINCPFLMVSVDGESVVGIVPEDGTSSRCADFLPVFHLLERPGGEKEPADAPEMDAGDQLAVR